MNALSGERLFEPFMDPVDGVLCLAAESNAGAVSQQAAPLGWRFPLWLDSLLPLSEHVRSSSHSPASSRFGPYCDNITGMNWQRLDGVTVRVGERVVKSTTGYDLLRFLLESGERYGRPLDYVLRLRPACDVSQSWHLHGELSALRQATSAVLRSSWIHWLESLDAIVGESTYLRAAVHCPGDELSVFEDYLKGISKDHGLEIQGMGDTSFAADGLPDFVVKTTVDRVFQTALDLAEKSGIRCVAICSSGVVLGYTPDTVSLLAILEPLKAGLHAHGGHWQSRHLSVSPASSTEAEWISILSKEWGGTQ